MRPQITTLSEETIKRLHRREICDAAEIAALLERVRATKVTLRNGVNRRNATRCATILWQRDGALGLRVENINPAQPQLFLSFSFDGRDYFFACATESVGSRRELIVRSPAAIYESERRDLRRMRSRSGGPSSVDLECSGFVARAVVEDFSYQGLGVTLPSAAAQRLEPDLGVRFIDGEYGGQESFGSVRHRTPHPDRPDWTRLGLSISYARSSAIAVDSRRRILSDRAASSRTRLMVAGAPARIASARIARRIGLGRQPSPPSLVEFQNSHGHLIRGILDAVGEPEGRTAVLVPPSWGRTKETFLPLSHTIMSTFAASGESASVLRFDGTNRRGESHIEPRFREMGDEYLGFTFSGAVEDIHAAVRFLKSAVRPSRIILVTFSLASVEGRRAMATDVAGSISGWISVVGMVDLQSGLRAVSGGIDFAYGLLEGVRFGRQELVGVVSDMDLTGEDALRHRMVFLEDAKRDMSAIKVPVTWIHGRHDAWMDLNRVMALLSSGDPAKRSLIEIPTGHQLHSSVEALETFQLIALEIGRIALGKALKAATPNPVALELAKERERSRRPALRFDAKSFWRSYLLGRTGEVGFQLLTATSAYRLLMAKQLEYLRLAGGDVVLDLGSGTGELAGLIAERCAEAGRIAVIEVDLIREALARSRARIATAGVPLRGGGVVANLDLQKWSLPIQEASVDAILLSLVVGYVGDPLALLRSAVSCLKPGGRLVLSSLRRDADISQIYVDGILELRPERLKELFGESIAARFESLQRDFLNSAAHLIDLEQDGRFRFFDQNELAGLLNSAGFERIRACETFGDPPQAVVIAGVRPEQDLPLK